jgi:hypothetical protein
MKTSSTHGIVLFAALYLLFSSSSKAQLEIRFFNYSTNAPSNVLIWPTDQVDSLWWTNSMGVSNSWSNYANTSNLESFPLSAVKVGGTNSGGHPYYSLYTTNYSGRFYICYGNSNIPNGGATPSQTSTNGNWATNQWDIFELTLSGATGDVCDASEINGAGIPIVIQTYQSTATNAPIYQRAGWTSTPTSSFTNAMTKILTDFPAAAKLSGGNLVMIAGPSSVPGSLTAVEGGAPVTFPPFTQYFNTLKTNGFKLTHAWLRDFYKNGDKTPQEYWYNFFLTVGADNSLVMNGNVQVISPAGTTNWNGSVNTNTTTNTFRNLNITILADSSNNPNEYWASSFVYGGFTPDNCVTNGVPITNSTGRHLLTFSTNNWAQMATNYGYSTNPPFETNYFAGQVMARIMGDAASGFALGFVGSGVTNTSYTNTNGVNVTYGKCPSGAWWGGREYTNSNTNNKAFALLQTNKNFYNQYAADIFASTPLVYGYTYSDRVQGIPVQIGCSTNNPGPNVKVVAVRMYNGISSVPLPGTKHTQTISFPAGSTNLFQIYTNNPIPFMPTATASSGLPVTFFIPASGTNVAQIISNMVAVQGAGTCSLVANQSGNPLYSAAAPVTNTLMVGKASQSISLSSSYPTNWTSLNSVYATAAAQISCSTPANSASAQFTILGAQRAGNSPNTNTPYVSNTPTASLIMVPPSGVGTANVIYGAWLGQLTIKANLSQTNPNNIWTNNYIAPTPITNTVTITSTNSAP